MNAIHRGACWALGALVVGGLLAASVAAPQESRRTRTPKETPKERKREKEGKREAVELVLPLKSADSTALEVVEGALRALSHPVYACPVCSLSQAGPGTCPECEEELEEGAETVHPVLDVDADASARTLRISLLSGQPLRLSEIERACDKGGVELSKEAIPMLPWSWLVVRLSDEEQETDDLREALGSLPFEVATLKHEEGAPTARVLLGRHRKGQASTLRDVKRALAEGESALGLTDVVWIGPCKACSKAGAEVAGCRRCSHENENENDG